MTPLQEQTIRRHLKHARIKDRTITTRYNRKEVTQKAREAMAQRHDDTLIALLRGMLWYSAQQKEINT